MIYIGIDPDIDKSGVAIVSKSSRLFKTGTMGFWALHRMLLDYKESLQVLPFMVYLEAGWLNRPANFHRATSKRVSDRIAKNVGENHAVGKLIEQLLVREKIPYQLVKPESRKWDAETYQRITGDLKTRTNSEMRDAAKLVYGL